MTVARLIQILQKLPQDSEVIVKGAVRDYAATPNIVGHEHYAPDARGGWVRKFPAPSPLPVMICLD